MAWIQFCLIAVLLPWIWQTITSDSDLDVCHQKDKYFCNDSRQCISKSYVCDGDEDCKQGEDEAPPACDLDACRQRDMIFCNDSRQCIYKSWVCDGRKHCKQGEDEAHPACALKKHCKSMWSLSEGCLGGCFPGYFGKYCEKDCSKECLNGTCNSISGICKDCTRTYLDNCSLECGKRCPEKEGFPQCDRQSGKCLHPCFPDHYGHFCNETCKHCKTNFSNDVCDVNGVCLFGCENDYWDKKCNTKCSANCQGDEHGNRCNSSTGECLNGCTTGWSGRFCMVSLDVSSTDKENVNSLAILIVVPAVATVVVIVVVVVGIICYLRARKRFNRQLNERMEPRRVFPVHIPPAQQPSRSRRRASSYVYDEVNEETMEHYHYICEQNAPDHYDKIKDRKPSICPHCVRERVIPFLNRVSSGSSSTTFVEPYAVGGGSISSRSYVSNSEINPRRSATKYDHDGGIVPTKEFTDDSNSQQSITKSDGKNELDSTDDSKPRRSVTRSDGALDHVGKTDYGEDVFGELGQFQAIERKECELSNNEIELQSMGQNIESSLSISRSELIEESCCSNNTDSIVKQQPDDSKFDDQTNTERSNSDEIKQTDSL